MDSLLSQHRAICYIFYGRIQIPSVYWENRAYAHSVYQALLRVGEGLGTRLVAYLAWSSGTPSTPLTQYLVIVAAIATTDLAGLV